MIKKIPYWFTSSFKHKEKIAFFRQVLYVFLILNTLTNLPIVNDLFGSNGIAGTRGFGWNGSSAFLNLLSHPINGTRPWIAWVFIFGQLICLSLGLLKKWPWLSSIGIYFFTANLFLKGGLFFTGGEILVTILLFYLIFIKEENNDSKLQNLLNNTFYYIILIQICVLYFFSTYFKLFDENWTSGMAMSYISDISFYSTDWFKAIFQNNPTLSKIATYSVLLYQILFFVLVWFKRIKIPFLWFGIALHLGISIGMGIFSFGIIMIISYILFLEHHHIDNLKHWFRLKKSQNNG